MSHRIEGIIAQHHRKKCRRLLQALGERIKTRALSAAGARQKLKHTPQHKKRKYRERGFMRTGPLKWNTAGSLHQFLCRDLVGLCKTTFFLLVYHLVELLDFWIGGLWS
jgi:hypothetical protein